MAVTGTKNVKSNTSRKKAAQKPPPKPKTGAKTSLKSAGASPPKKARKRKKPGSRDLGHAVLLTAILIAASAVISITVIGIKRAGSPDTVTDFTMSRSDTSPSDTSFNNAASNDASRNDTATDFTMPPSDTVAATVPATPKVAPAITPTVIPTATPVAPSTTTPITAPTATSATAPTAAIPTKTPIVTPTTASKATPTATPRTTPVATPTITLAAPPELPKPVYQGTLVFVIDDAGNNLQELEPFLRFPGPLTIAVLPGLPHSAEAARRIRAAGKEVFLHQPMEAIGGQNPGPGAIYAGMTADEILTVLHKNLAEIGPIAGMNNHQGSKVTMDREMMETVLAFCREKGICFLDSRTTSETAVPAAAQNMGIKIGERNIFIDNEQNRPSMIRYIESGLDWASQKGSAVMIGHTWSPELAPLLAESREDLVQRGYRFATASDVINR